MKPSARIQCRDHGYAPWGILCNHLFTRERKDAIKLADADYDHVCPNCFGNIDALAKEDEIAGKNQNLHAVCMHCIRKLGLTIVQPKG
jgi:hypothetical protein